MEAYTRQVYAPHWYDGGGLLDVGFYEKGFGLPGVPCALLHAHGGACHFHPRRGN